MKEKIKKELVRRFQEADWGDIRITMKSDGNVLTLTPCSTCMDIRSEEDVEYVLVYGRGAAQWMSGELGAVADSIARYDSLAAEYDSDVEKLKAYGEEHKDMPYGSDEYQLYSDWHKDVMGYRPNGWLFGTSRH